MSEFVGYKLKELENRVDVLHRMLEMVVNQNQQMLDRIESKEDDELGDMENEGAEGE